MNKWNNGFVFLKLDKDATYEDAMAKEKDFYPVEIPHDYLIYDTNNLYEDSTGWYMKKFQCHLPQADEKVFVTFDGVYMDSLVYVNGQLAKEWKYGYSAFEADITEYLKEGENCLVVRAKHESPNSRWYSGAGIYRNVWIRQVKDSYIVSDGIYVHSEKKEHGYEMTVETVFAVLGQNAENKADGLQVKHQLSMSAKNCSDEQCCINVADIPNMQLLSSEKKEQQDGTILDRQVYMVESPAEWDVDCPVLYRLESVLETENGEQMDTYSMRIGFRTIEINPDKGFLLNGRVLKMNGVCEHHDLGALGAAFHVGAQRRKYIKLKKMGVNAIRFAHNMPARECLDLADEMGLLVMDENFDMWEKSKTTYDYARFFNEWYEKDMESFVRRDRNHPCVVLWSIGNEIYDTHADAKRGSEIITDLMEVVRKFDPYKNAYITLASNYMPWENTQECAKLLEAVGYNYSERYYKEHHDKYKNWVIFGSETSSIVYSRGIYHFPLNTKILSDDDEQCSALLNSITSWGAKSIEDCICDDRDMEFSMGQFIWTGTDYIGEPTPYHTKNSYFGQIDTAGFPKDSYYVYQAEWTDFKKNPMVHVFPYWDFNEGQQIDIRVCSNAPEVELFVNGESLGRQKLDHKPGSGKHILADYQAVYKPGSLCAVAYDENGQEVCRDEHVSFKDSKKIVAQADKEIISCAEDDILFVEISAVDEDGHPVENATDRVMVEVSGPAVIVGLDNGDSTDYDGYKSANRKLFGGKLLAMVKANGCSGEIGVKVSAEGLETAELTVKCTGFEETSVFNEVLKEEKKKEIPVRKLEMVCSCGSKITPETGECRVKAQVLPVDASDREIYFRAVNDSGVTTNLVQIVQEENEAVIKPMGDGSFKLRCVSKSGTETVRIISELNFCTEGFGDAYLNPYEFISGSMHSGWRGEIAAGNERGVASARNGETIIIYDNIDFGSVGSDEITIPIFALNSEKYPIEIYEGIPREGGTLLAEVVYQKPSIWNVYQEDTFTLQKRLVGVKTISFVVHDKVHIKGFSFKKYEKAYMTLKAVSADQMYGDSYVIQPDVVEGIGNNVSVVFEDMNFTKQVKAIRIKGRALKGNNTIHVRFGNGAEESKQIVEFKQCNDYEEQRFELEPVEGKWEVSFVFMPGSYFDFDEFTFE